MRYHIILERWPLSKTLQTLNAGGGMGNWEPSYAIGGEENWYCHNKEHYEGSLKN